MKKCPICKTILDDDDLYCHECGVKQELIPPQSKPKQQHLEDNSSFGEKLMSYAWVFILLLGLAVGGAIWYLFNDNSQEQLMSETHTEKEDVAEINVVDLPNENEGELLFLKDFYRHYLDDNYLRKNITNNVYNKLRNDYDYDCDTNDCLATWIFTAYPPGADFELEEGPIISKTSSAGKFKVDFNYSGFNGEQKNYYTNTVYLTVTTVDDKYLISDYEVEYQEEEPMEEISDSALPANNEIIMSGTVSKYSIHMVLQIDGTNVTGYYYYDSQDSDNKVKLSGNINEDNIMKLEKYDSQGSQTGYFEGQFDGNTYSGSNINYSRDEALPFSVEKTN